MGRQKPPAWLYNTRPSGRVDRHHRYPRSPNWRMEKALGKRHYQLTKKGVGLLTRLPNRGGNWNNAGNAGLSALNLNNHRSNANSNRGGRLANDGFANEPITLTGVWAVHHSELIS